MKVQVMTPPGRIVQGSCHDGRAKDNKGADYVYKSGPNVGQPYKKYFIGIAIDKAAVDHCLVKREGSTAWEPCNLWGIVQEVAKAGWPQLFDPQGNCHRADFSWKIVDGDSHDQNGQPYSAREGFAGCWVVKCTSNFPPNIFDKGGVPMTREGEPRRGDFARVSFDLEDNNPSESPGVYINHKAIEFQGYGNPIVGGINGEEMFGGAQSTYTPQGMSATPVAPAGGAPAPAPGGAPGPAPAPASAPPPAATTPPATTPPAPAPGGAAPAPGGTTPPAQAAPPPPAAVAPPPPAPAWTPEMTAKAQAEGLTYAALQAANWTDAQMHAEGYITDCPPF